METMKTYWEIREKTLTPAEKKKREEVAKAIERDNPNMPMDKKMAIATATAKKVAEQSEELDELRQSTVRSYVQKAGQDAGKHTVRAIFKKGERKQSAKRALKRVRGVQRANRLYGDKE